jgi:mono/diheme cytochrome c family protein
VRPVVVVGVACTAALAFSGCGTGGYTSQGSQGSGKKLFVQTCGGCHTLADAGTSGATGPNLDDASPDAATVKAYVRGGGGGMPAFGDTLSNAEVDAVAAYVSSVAGG